MVFYKVSLYNFEMPEFKKQNLIRFQNTYLYIMFWITATLITRTQMNEEGLLSHAGDLFQKHQE